jgi:hypothetical protein
MWRKSAIVIAVLWCAWPARARAELAYSQQVVDQTCDFFEWAFELQMTVSQREDGKVVLEKFWKQKDHKSIAAVQGVLDARAQLLAAKPEVRAQTQHEVQTKLLAALRKDPNDPASKWLLGVYDSAHVSLVQGDPPLTRQSVDALAELLGFMSGQASKGKPVVPDTKYKDALTKALVTGWKDVPDATKQQLGQIPAYWAAIRTQWASASESDRKQLRAQWAKSFTPAKGKAGPKSPDDIMLATYAEKMKHEVAMQALDAIGCSAQRCAWKYEYRWVP